MGFHFCQQNNPEKKEIGEKGFYFKNEAINQISLLKLFIEGSKFEATKAFSIEYTPQQAQIKFHVGPRHFFNLERNIF